ncbi:MAG: ABC transporter ATP-binding protein [Candidatus Aureabacteria bacterium]|nr:ABC transporter ATP-binding protein [Candidatus Auribacterota bacterium]
MIEYIHVSKSFDGLKVLEDVSCTIREGKITVFIGPSGVGKSVMMKMIVGLEAPDTGSVLVDGDEVNGMNEARLYRLRRKIGMLFQDGALFDSMTAGDNVAFPLRQHTRMPEGEIRRIVAEKLSLVGMPGCENKLPSELSGGMRKRVGLARAIALNPEIVLFDEPTSGLDPLMAAAIDSLIIEMQRRLGCTFVVISHDIPGTFTIADRIGVLYDTRLISYGTREEIRGSRDPVLVEFFARNMEPHAQARGS